MMTPLQKKENSNKSRELKVVDEKKSREQCSGEVMMGTEVRREDGADERHIVFGLTSTQRWSAAASCQQDSLWAFLETLPVLKWFAGAGLVCTLRVTGSLWVNKAFVWHVCAYRAHLRARRRSERWVKRKKGELWCEEEKRTSNKLSARVWTPRSHWQSLSSLPRRSLTSPSLSRTHTSKSATSNPFPHLHPGRGLAFSSNQNKSLR